MHLSLSSLVGLLLAVAAVAQTPEPTPIRGKVVPQIRVEFVLANQNIYYASNALLEATRELNDKYQRRPVMLMLDGDTYDVRFTQLSTDIHFTVPQSPARSALEKWAE